MRCYWFVNHAVSDSQRDELKNRFNVDEVIAPSRDFSLVWSALPAEEELHPELVEPWIDVVNAPSIAVVQGDSTYSFYVVDALLSKGVRVFAATTERVVEECVMKDRTEIKRIFRHKAFREYRRRECIGSHYQDPVN